MKKIEKILTRNEFLDELNTSINYFIEEDGFNYETPIIREEWFKKFSKLFFEEN